MTILPFGDRGLLVQVDSLDAVLGLHAGLDASRPAGVVDLVPAARTVLVRVDPAVLPLPAARAWVAATTPVTDAEARPVRDVELPIVYDGPDLAETAKMLGVGVEALVRRHTATGWTVAFAGFAPGFGYLVGDDWPYDVPRLAAPRSRVPTGAVGLAGVFSGAYPRATPGGWRLIGTTDAVLFDPTAADPALLVPGARVRFVPVRSTARMHPTGEDVGISHRLARQMQSRRRGADGARSVEAETAAAARANSTGAAVGDAAGAAADDSATAAIEVLDPGLLATVQDLGRPGGASRGIATAGALDRAALRAANRLVGNDEDAAGIEITMGGFRARALHDVWVAITGGDGPLRLGGRAVDGHEPLLWEAGGELQVDWLSAGARAYLAVRGGVDAPVVAGSRATDTMAGLGPAPLRAGDLIATADAASAPVPPAEPAMTGGALGDLEIALAPGPRADWFDASSRATLFDAVWTVTDRADRVGIRLDGPALARAARGPGDGAAADELPSEGMIPGAVQVPPDGRPVILMADGPVTGGYPVIAVVTDAALDLLAQARPGSRIRFRHARLP